MTEQKTAAQLLRQLRAEGHAFDMACAYGCHTWRYDLAADLKTCIGSCGGVYQMNAVERRYAETLATAIAREPALPAVDVEANERYELRERLVHAALASGLTLDVLAQRMEITGKALRDYINSATDPRLSMHQRLARAVGLRVRIVVEPAEDGTDG